MPEPFYIDSDDVDGLIALVQEKLNQRYGQDATIGAIRRLGDLRDKRAIPVLRRALNHANAGVKQNAAFALAKLGVDLQHDTLTADRD